jgi:hypothetical protein
MDDGIDSLNCPMCLHPVDLPETPEGVRAQCGHCGFKSEVAPWAEGENKPRPVDFPDLPDIYFS